MHPLSMKRSLHWRDQARAAEINVAVAIHNTAGIKGRPAHRVFLYSASGPDHRVDDYATFAQVYANEIKSLAK